MNVLSHYSRSSPLARVHHAETTPRRPHGQYALKFTSNRGRIGCKNGLFRELSSFSACLLSSSPRIMGASENKTHCSRVLHCFSTDIFDAAMPCHAIPCHAMPYQCRAAPRRQSVIVHRRFSARARRLCRPAFIRFAFYVYDRGYGLLPSRYSALLHFDTVPRFSGDTRIRITSANRNK